MPSSSTVAELMSGLRNGDHRAASELVERFYPELKRIAMMRMRSERSNHTLRPTALVNELYLELVRIKALRESGPGAAEERQQFLALASHVMKRLLLNYARRLPGHGKRDLLTDLPNPESSSAQALFEVEDALNRLEAIMPRLRRVVELRVFEGLTREEIAGRLNCGTATVARDWDFARHWLETEFAGPGH